MAMAVYWILFPAILTSFFAPTSQNQPDDGHLNGELLDAKFKIARLESVLEESIQKLNGKNIYLKERKKLIQDMDEKIGYLQSALLNLKDDSLHADERVKALVEEVQLLWAASRKNNFNLHILEAEAQNAEDKLALVTSQVQKMAEVITEQWIQIQHLEQALEIAKIRAVEEQRQRSMRCTFLKFISDLSEVHLPMLLGALNFDSFGSRFGLASYTSQALERLKRLFSSVKKYHHELQAFVKNHMVRNEFTAALANEELVFILASALITFPILSAWMFLSSLFSR
ncbi:hypothetical protein SLEP1_g54610 [Rubroshorea leprosula]|uniref:Tropomyosin n=1 Tax=Rubroshorea leprosula TaxID=152421 RepID=A0AAV5MG39_9ROSI|nr:hypothetical protein SLEP1_g54610 [Rubroshorea leprosula]